MKDLIRFLLCLVTVLRTTVAEEVIYAQVGDTVNLKIKNSPTINYYIYWFFGTENNKFAWFTHLGGLNTNLDEMWKNRLSLTINSLTIKNIQDEHFGLYFSEVLENQEKAKARYRLIKVSVEMTPPSPVMPSESVVLNCAVKTPLGLRKPNVYWMNPQGKTENGVEGKLQFKARSQASGEWKCVINNDKNIPISVSVADFSPAPLPLYTSKSSFLKVPFFITPNNMMQEIIQKITKVEWFFTPKTSNRQRLFSLMLGNKGRANVDQDRGLKYANFTKGGDISLSRNWAREDDGGNYTCAIKFLNNYTLTSSVQVEVLQIIPSPGPKLISGNPLNLSCTTGDQLLPGLKMKWSHPKALPLKDADYLVIPKVSTDDSGTWECELQQNQARLTSAKIVLNIEPILSVWMLVTICSVGLILILLLVVAFILYRRRQRKMRHLRHRLCQCAHPKPKGFYKT